MTLKRWVKKKTKIIRKRYETITIHSVFSDIKFSIPRYIYNDGKHRASTRPFSEFTGINSGYFSLKLQRIITDFSINNNFRDVSKKLKEHYNLDIGTTSIKSILYNKVGVYTKDFYEHLISKGKITEALVLEVQVDGVFIPIALYNKTKSIGEDNRVKLIYREVKHVGVIKPGKIKGLNFAVITPKEKIKEFSKDILKILKLSGFSKNTEVFGLADGAKWIENLLKDDVFKENSFYYLIDFFHLAEYIHDAVKSLPDSKKYLIDKFKTMAKEGRTEDILKEIKDLKLIEESIEVIRNIDKTIKGVRVTVKEKVNLVKALYDYINNRYGNFDYPFFRKNNMPNGTGRIESANKILVKKRMDIPFGWTEKNANTMLELIMIKNNGFFEQFWQYVRSKKSYNKVDYLESEKAA